MTTLAGTRMLIRLAIRRDRFNLPAWILGMTAILVGTTAGLIGDLTPQDLRAETEMNANSPALRLFGLASGPSAGAYAMLRNYFTIAILAALMSILAVVRHTRQSEETGRAELVGAAVIGRHAWLAAAVVVTTAANVVLSAFLALGLIATGQPVAGSFAAGASVGAVGIFFAAVAAVTAQLTSTTRSASGMAAAGVGIAFVLSGVGNVLGSIDATGVRVVSAWPAWLSPIGWGEQMRPFGGNHWWPLGLFAIVSLALFGFAGLLITRRDLGRGVLPQRAGPAGAGRGLRGPAGLAWRLQRGSAIGWLVGVLAFGVIFGAVSGQAEDLTGSALEWYRRLGGTDQIVDAFLTSIVEMGAMAIAIYAVQVLLRIHAEEADGPLEAVLATATSRRRWIMAHIAAAGSGIIGLSLVFAIGLAMSAGQALGGTPGLLRDLILAGFAQLPAILVIGAVTVASTAVVPKWSGLVSWSALTASILVGPLFGPTLGFPRWVQNMSPFSHVPKAPAADITAAPLLTLTVIAAAALIVGATAFRNRNLALPA